MKPKSKGAQRHNKIQRGDVQIHETTQSGTAEQCRWMSLIVTAHNMHTDYVIEHMCWVCVCVCVLRVGEEKGVGKNRNHDHNIHMDHHLSHLPLVPEAPVALWLASS